MRKERSVGRLRDGLEDHLPILVFLYSPIAFLILGVIRIAKRPAGSRGTPDQHGW